MGKPVWATVSAIVLVAVSGCASRPPREVYVVLPKAGGEAGTVAVTLKDGREEILHGDYRAMTLVGDKAETYVADPVQTDKTFGRSLAAMPRPPMSASLFFVKGRASLQYATLIGGQVVAVGVREDPANEVRIAGTTDTVGSDAYNEALSLKRAERVRQTLVRLGIPAENIVAKGKGKRELLIKTPDNTGEPRNRRVDISVR